MPDLAVSAIDAKFAIKYVYELPNIESILFGVSLCGNIEQTVGYIREFDNKAVVK